MQDQRRRSVGHFFRRLRGYAAVAAILGGLLSTGCAQRAGCCGQLAKVADQRSVDVVEEFYANGAPRLRKEVIRSADGKPINHGAYVRWYPDGQKEYEAHFVRGKKQGTTTQWHRNGCEWIEQTYCDGAICGTSRTWDDQGRLRSEQHFDSGMPSGTWTTWDADGNIKSQQNFDETTQPPH